MKIYSLLAIFAFILVGCDTAKIGSGGFGNESIIGNGQWYVGCRIPYRVYINEANAKLFEKDCSHVWVNYMANGERMNSHAQFLVYDDLYLDSSSTVEDLIVRAERISPYLMQNSSAVLTVLEGSGGKALYGVTWTLPSGGTLTGDYFGKYYDHVLFGFVKHVLIAYQEGNDIIALHIIERIDFNENPGAGVFMRELEQSFSLDGMLVSGVKKYQNKDSGPRRL